ncbi:hypothetical protein EJ06DRAFT_538656 [Trichodelitschia bisporula]|uniref:Integral membrane protein n=1 Tax=Trichodelitschia bisporula TaxID=703511 RepID=A0A6G1HRV4_9PEZI|nr:hypothetical protein EJ06DRAFT_538656 [Trichodelitschia bisporula]
MYSKKSWGGSRDPVITVTADAPIALVIFEYSDKDLVGRPDGDTIDFICDDGAVERALCNSTQRGEFLLAPDAAARQKLPILTKALAPADSPSYPIVRTGYYCVFVYSESEFHATVEFRNAYGELPAAEIPKLPFYGGLTLVYAVIGAFWAFLYVQHRSDILAVQNYITAIIIFLVVEMLMTWGFYDYQNVHGSNLGAKVFMIVVAVLNAGRNSFSLFLLLIVCMGYGVVKPSLGRTMIAVRWLAATHFVCDVIYAVASLTVRPDEAGAMVLLVVVPLAATLTAFYVWTLNSIGQTMRDLVARKQHVKAGMYKKLWWCLLGSIIFIFLSFFATSFTVVTVDADSPQAQWKTRWFVLDGWLNLVYLANVAYIAYLWRPTANNRRFAMSDELAQDDEGFEINSVRDSLDSDVEAAAAHGKHTPSDSTDAGGAGGAASVGASAPPAYSRRDQSPLPAPKPQKPSSLPKRSLEADTLFEVGDEDRWSGSGSGDEESEDEEREGLVRGGGK